MINCKDSGDSNHFSSLCKRPVSLGPDRERRRVDRPEAKDKMDTPMRSPSPTKCSKGTDGESTRVKRTLIEGLEAYQTPSHKRKWEDANPASIRGYMLHHLTVLMIYHCR